MSHHASTSDRDTMDLCAMRAPLALTGMVVTGEALHARRGGDQCGWDTGNQPRLLADQEVLVAEQPAAPPSLAVTSAHTVDNGYGYSIVPIKASCALAI